MMLCLMMGVFGTHLIFTARETCICPLALRQKDLVSDIATMDIFALISFCLFHSSPSSTGSPSFGIITYISILSLYVRKISREIDIITFEVVSLLSFCPFQSSHSSTGSPSLSIITYISILSHYVRKISREITIITFEVVSLLSLRSFHSSPLPLAFFLPALASASLLFCLFPALHNTLFANHSNIIIIVAAIAVAAPAVSRYIALQGHKEINIHFAFRALPPPRTLLHWYGSFFPSPRLSFLP